MPRKKETGKEEQKNIMRSFVQTLLFAVAIAFTAANSGVKTRTNWKGNKDNLRNGGRFRPFPWPKPGGGSMWTHVKVTNDSDAIVIEVDPDQSGHSDLFKRIEPPSTCAKPNTCLDRCSNERQYHNVTGRLHHPQCFCDPECNSVFHDCCADYENHCSQFQRKNESRGRWKCSLMQGLSSGVWMIGSCESKWSNKEVKRKCTAISRADLRKPSIMIPVIDENNNTFRNRFCAECNHVKKFMPWTFTGIGCNSKSFLDDVCNAKRINFTLQARAIRYCYDVEDKCKYDDIADAVKDCKTATTGLVSFDNRTYRNFGCLLCNNKPVWSPFPLQASCEPTAIGSRIVSFAQLFQIDSKVPLRSPRCGPGFLYDTAVRYCRKLVNIGQLRLNKLLKRYSVRLSYKADKNLTACLARTVAFKRQIELRLMTGNWTISDLEVHVINNASYFVTFQSLGITTDNQNASRYRGVLTQINDIYLSSNSGDTTSTSCKYYLIQDSIQEMTCSENRNYELRKPESILKNGSVFVNETQEYYKAGEYMVYQHKNETRLAVCKDYRPAKCSYYLDIKNTRSWKMFPNRSIYSNITESLFDYGEYSLIDGTLWLCLTKNHLGNTNRILRMQNSIHNNILSYLTLVSLTISLLSLAVLFTIYSVFSSLRNLPGKNLMLLCGVLALCQLLWLLQSVVYSLSSGLCIALSVALQYLFLATFSCSCSIAFHSFTTFNGIAKGRLRRQAQGNAFLWYALQSLGLPFVLVTISWLLDFYKVISIGYGSGQGHCWLAGGNALYAAFFAPVFILLSINLTFLLATARAIHKCTKASRDLAEKNGGPNKKHVGIYLRMSTVMGFTWLFGLFQLIFPEVVVFEYLFVIINGLQGFYIAVAFLFTYNVRKMVSTNLSKVSSAPSRPNTGNTKS